jgi:hypothetical protein
MALLNVRLDDEDARKAAALRRAGVPISTVVRDAIRTEYEQRIARPKALRRASQIVAEILTSLPDPPDLPPRSFDVHDRRAARRHITDKLARARS